MLKKIVQKQNASKLISLINNQKRCFSHGPYNPLHYKTVLVPEGMPSTDEYYSALRSVHSNPPPPIYNMRHIHPVR